MIRSGKDKVHREDEGIYGIPRSDWRINEGVHKHRFAVQREITTSPLTQHCTATRHNIDSNLMRTIK